MTSSKDSALKERAARVIPGGMYGHQSVTRLPDGFPQFFSRAEGAYLWDADGNRLLDFMCAYGPQLFGYGNPAIDSAYVDQLAIGDVMTGPSHLMVDLAEALVSMISHADWAMFCKNGTDANTIALMIARAHTRRTGVVRTRGAYHGAAPWSNPRAGGVTRADQADQHLCDYNDVGSLEAAVAAAGDNLAVIFATPFKHDVFVDQAAPTKAFATRARELADETGALLVVDDVRAGFRIARDCSWSIVGVEPDLSCWGKCIANGHPLSALVGSDEARGGAEAIFTTGSYWFAGAAMAASLATLAMIRSTNYLERIEGLGNRLRIGLQERSAAHGFRLRQSGPPQMPLVLFEDDADMRLGYFWSSQMVSRGVYVHPWHNMFLSAAMNEADIDAALDAADASFIALSLAAPRLGLLEKVAKGLV
ncbi:MAG: aminotransferase class III-fold pyridoxal phosphate-dependent enzyme [Alphaproteobacteria bacterium]|nr:aminotransferase class III-fold pyridoxal phosphate-dependent enzyme [Alphaproteobacteria bacterium]